MPTSSATSLLTVSPVDRFQFFLEQEQLISFVGDVEGRPGRWFCVQWSSGLLRNGQKSCDDLKRYLKKLTILSQKSR